MTSYYLTAEAEEKRIAVLVTRLVSEALPSPCGGPTWAPESDFWKLPASMQRVVASTQNKPCARAGCLVNN